jgi:uncharacterized damage-inducible protein DinB
MIGPGRWFDRKFNLGSPVSAAPDLFARLLKTADRLEDAVHDVPGPMLVHRRDGRWSIQEHAGHLLDLEPLWVKRLDDFDAGAAVLHAADLENRKTHEARHNERAAHELTSAFREARTSILARLQKMSAPDLMRTALHPRLRQPMSVLDLCFFVAEHDDHHLQTMTALATTLREMPVYALELVNTIDAALPRLKAIDGESASVQPRPGKWSPIQIVGHLIDSASNNHQRFVRAMFQDDLVFAGYAPDDWVAAQNYEQAPWDDLVTLWASFNRHLARVMASVPEPVRQKAHTRHNFDQIAFQPLPPGSPATLDYFMQDYVRHLQHHLRQIPGAT